MGVTGYTSYLIPPATRFLGHDQETDPVGDTDLEPVGSVVQDGVCHSSSPKKMNMLCDTQDVTPKCNTNGIICWPNSLFFKKTMSCILVAERASDFRITQCVSCETKTATKTRLLQ